MASSKITDLTEEANPTRDDILALVDDPTGSPASGSVTLADHFKAARDVVLLVDTGVPDTGGPNIDIDLRDYHEFGILILDFSVQADTDGTDLYMQCYTDSGGFANAAAPSLNKFAEYTYNGSVSTYESNAANTYGLQNNMSSGANAFSVGRVWMQNWNGQGPTYCFHEVAQKLGGAPIATVVGGCKWDTGADLTGIRMAGGGSGLLDTGKATLWGIRGGN